MNSKKNKPQRREDTKKTKKRWIVFGPGIMAALMLSLFVTAKNFTLFQGKPPVIEKQVSLGKEQPVYAPELPFLITNRKKFRLSEKQTALIKNLHKKYDEDARPLKKELKEATAQLAVYFNEKEKGGNRVAFKAVHEQSQNYQQLSRDLSQLRKFYWEQGINVLSESQKKIAEEEIAKMMRLSKKSKGKEVAP